MKRIKSIEVNSSYFFEDKFKIVFNDKLNCIMGGRGTGKSTLLHMIYASLDNEAEYDKTTYSILKNNLGEGNIILNVEDADGKIYKIKKTFNDSPQPYLSPTDKYIPIENIKNSIQCDIYKAAFIEEIGMNSKSRLSLIDKMLSNEIKQLYNEVEKKQITLNDNMHFPKIENTKVRQLEENLKDYDNAEQELDSHKKEQPEDIIPEEKEQFERADKNEKIRFAEKLFVDKISLEIKALISDLADKEKRINGFIANDLLMSEVVNKEILEPIIKEAKDSFTKIQLTHNQSLTILRAALVKINKLIHDLSAKHQIQQNEFVALKQKFDKHKLYYTKYHKLSQRISEKQNLQKTIKELKNKRDGIKNDRKKLVSELNKIKKDIFNKRFKKIQSLNQQFNNSIKITLTFSGITDEYEEALQNALRGSGMRYNVIIPNIINNFTPDKFAEIVHTKDYDTLKNIAGIDKERSEAIFNVLYETDDIYKIESIYCPDLPEFLLKVDRKGKASSKDHGDFKKTDELSTGQRCTTILPIIFAVSKNPLLIDQPEDNLDNEYISDTIHKIIRSEKELRQLIFITHNPNIPVLADAEYNIFLSYSNKKSLIEKDGDVNSVKNNILDLLEGGKEAFDKRKTLYGF